MATIEIKGLTGRQERLGKFLRGCCRYPSQQAGPKVAAILSVVESCRRLKIPAGDYLTTALPGLATWARHADN
jgi:hypothetical protein